MNTEILAVLDISGSMERIKADAIGGFNTFLKDQQAIKGEARLTVVLFDDQYEVLYCAKPLAEAEPLNDSTFVPRGATALMDAIGRTIEVEGARIEAEGWAEKVIVCITTDGEENNSHRYNYPAIRELVKAAEARGWVFVFLAANQDAFATASHYGFNPAHAQNFAATGAGMTQAYASISNTTRALRTGESVLPKSAEAALTAKPPKKAAKSRKGA